MELFLIASKNLLKKEQLKVLENHFKLVKFVKLNDIESFDYNKNDKEEKVLLLDPDFFDWKFQSDIFDKIKNLNYVCLTTTTASYVDEDYLNKNKIKLLTIPKYSTDSVAEYLMFLMFCLAKRLPLQLKNENKQEFTDEYLQMELTGKKVGVVGLGNIGNRVCELASGIGMNVVYWNRTQKHTTYTFDTLQELFKTSDVIFLTLANNSATRALITDELLNSMKKSVILVSNTGIALHNDKIIREKLKNNQIFGFGAELPNGGSGDYEGNAMITSEYAWFTKEATQRRIDILMNNLLSIK